MVSVASGFTIVIVLMLSYIACYVAFAVYVVKTGKKLKMVIINKGRLISLMPTIAITHVVVPASQFQDLPSGLNVDSYNMNIVNEPSIHKVNPPPYAP